LNDFFNRSFFVVISSARHTVSVPITIIGATGRLTAMRQPNASSGGIGTRYKPGYQLLQQRRKLRGAARRVSSFRLCFGQRFLGICRGKQGELIA
jgi:hypothetical protein